MAYTIKYLGSQVETTTDKTIVVANCATDSNDALLVFAGAYDPEGEPTVDYGGVQIVGDDWRVAPVSRVAGGIWHKNTVWNGRTADVTVTFGTNVTRRWCIVYGITNGGRKDAIKRNVQDVDTDVPNSLVTDVLTRNNELMMGYHLSNGPITDVAGTPEAGLSLLHRIGTSIGADDITVQTTTKEVVATDGVRSRMTGATSRKWLSAVITVRPIVTFPATDGSGSELDIGDTVTYQGVQYTILDIIREPGMPYARVDMGNGIVTRANNVDLVE